MNGRIEDEGKSMKEKLQEKKNLRANKCCWMLGLRVEEIYE